MGAVLVGHVNRVLGGRVDAGQAGGVAVADVGVEGQEGRVGPAQVGGAGDGLVVVLGEVGGEEDLDAGHVGSSRWRIAVPIDVAGRVAVDR